MKIINLFRGKNKIKNLFSKNTHFATIKGNKKIFLYAGDVPHDPEYKKYIGLSLSQSNKNHIKHDITKKHELYDNSIEIYQAEDVFEHIPYNTLPKVINDIHRILKPGGIFRLSVPDYNCDILNNRSQKNGFGEILFDPGGGGEYIDGKITKGGHLWFPEYSSVHNLLSKSNFNTIRFYHYYDENKNPITLPIDYTIGYVKRTPDNDKRVQKPFRPLSIVVDCIK